MSGPAAAIASFEPGARVLLDAHNCYPEHGRWSDRLDRALATGVPLAIEQDLVWFRDPATGAGRSLVAHDEPGKPALGLTGSEPSMREHFFERVRPLVERALREQRRDAWPIITLNLDFKTEEPEHLVAVLALLTEYKSWLTTAPRGTMLAEIQPLTVGPLLVLTGESDAQRKVFHDDVPAGQPLLVFGAARPWRRGRDVGPGPRTNYHRWWNNPWSVVEEGGQVHAGIWTPEDETRLDDLVTAAHRAGLWIRFYTLNGYDRGNESNGWTASYNFGSAEAVRERWRAAIRAGVDFVATDQYEGLAETLRTLRPQASEIVLEGELTRDDHKTLFERAFDVPPGTARLEVQLSYSGVDEKTVVDLGLRGPAGFRGWSGGGPQTIVVGATRASYGYQPGPVEPGPWAVVLGVPNIRVGRQDRYRLAVRLWSADDAPAPVLRTRSGWYVGDLHAHSGHSDGRSDTNTGARVHVPTHRVFDAARAADLDFVALTDHNTASHWLDVDRLQPYYGNLLLLHGREITTYRGHANALGERGFHDFRAAGASLASVLAGPAADGAFVSINHPASPDDESCMGCKWMGLDPATLALVGGIELVNGSSAAEPPAWPVWVEMLNHGGHVTAVGGSDEHTPDEVVDRRIGTPATVVFADELSEPAIVRGLGSGRVYIRMRGPEGPELDFRAEYGGRRYEMGQTIPTSGALRLLATVIGGRGQRVEWVRNGERIATSSVGSAGQTALDVTASGGDWFTVVVRDDTGPTAFANPIYVGR